MFAFRSPRGRPRGRGGRGALPAQATRRRRARRRPDPRRHPRHRPEQRRGRQPHVAGLRGTAARDAGRLRAGRLDTAGCGPDRMPRHGHTRRGQSRTPEPASTLGRGSSPGAALCHRVSEVQRGPPAHSRRCRWTGKGPARLGVRDATADRQLRDTGGRGPEFGSLPGPLTRPALAAALRGGTSTCRHQRVRLRRDQRPCASGGMAAGRAGVGIRASTAHRPHRHRGHGRSLRPLGRPAGLSGACARRRTGDTAHHANALVGCHRVRLVRGPRATRQRFSWPLHRSLGDSSGSVPHSAEGVGGDASSAAPHAQCHGERHR